MSTLFGHNLFTVSIISDCNRHYPVRSSSVECIYETRQVVQQNCRVRNFPKKTFTITIIIKAVNPDLIELCYRYCHEYYFIWPSIGQCVHVMAKTYIELYCCTLCIDNNPYLLLKVCLAYHSHDNVNDYVQYMRK